MVYLKYYSIFISSLLCSLASTYPQGVHIPEVVDLGYAKHRPTWVNTTATGTELLNYNNIRYAEPPTGWKRFRKPVTPPPYQHGIQDGNITSWETDCTSTGTIGIPFPLLNGSTWGSEDCLFLNVVVPKGVKAGDKLPVLHWVVGSAYAFGGKDWTGFGINTYGLYNRPLNLTDQFIIVTHNYRLGINGWLPKLEDDMNGNIGVWDSLAAIEWTKTYISRFGGDPDNITVMGQSAGAAIIEWLLLGEGGNLTLPFNQAIISSPAVPPRGTLERSRPVFHAILNATGCDKIECMRQVPESAIRDANEYFFNLPNAGGGGALGLGIGLAPLVDGELLTELPAVALAKGQFNKGIKQLIVGNTADEGMGTASDRDMPGRFPTIVQANIPKISNDSISQLQKMYSFQPELPEKLAWDYTTDVVFRCPARTIAKAYPDKARRYEFSVSPAFHGSDIVYFFFADNTTTPVLSLETAFEAQNYLLQYLFREDFPVNPEASYAAPLSEWKHVGMDGTMANITLAGFEFHAPDEMIERRCDFINALLEDPSNGV